MLNAACSHKDCISEAPSCSHAWDWADWWMLHSQSQTQNQRQQQHICNPWHGAEISRPLHSTPLRQQDRRRTLFTRRKRCIAGEAACGGTKCAGKICWHNSDEWSLHGNNLSCLVMNLQPSSVCHFNSVQSARSTGTSGATSWAPLPSSMPFLHYLFWSKMPLLFCILLSVATGNQQFGGWDESKICRHIYGKAYVVHGLADGGSGLRLGTACWHLVDRHRTDSISMCTGYRVQSTKEQNRDVHVLDLSVFINGNAVDWISETSMQTFKTVPS
jgi:hypothetical protein